MHTRTKLLIKESGIEKLKKAHVLIVGLGGVGGYAAEQLCRAGVGNLTLVDGDTISITNINRQIIATTNTVGMMKTKVLEERLKSINPECNIRTISEFIRDDRMIEILKDQNYDYVVDAIDTTKNKIELIEKCQKENVRIITATGAGNKLDATKFEIADIYKTSVCPVCKILRKELKNRNIKKLKVLYSKEIPQKPNNNGERTLGSVSFVPSVAGLIIAGEVIKDIIKGK